MALYAVIALKEGPAAVDEAVETKITAPNSLYKIESGKWVVKDDVATAKELSTNLGLASTTSHIILPIRGYFGRAQPDLWEWLAKTDV